MITKIVIEDYKSIEHLELELGRINVFIGENGAGKSNILEAIAFAGAANANKLDNEFLVSRGIRVTSPRFMHSAFPDSDNKKNTIKIAVFDAQKDIKFTLQNEGKDYSRWIDIRDFRLQITTDILIQKFITEIGAKIRKEDSKDFKAYIESKVKEVESEKFVSLNHFVIYAPENSSLRVFEKEGQIQPLGINGEGLLKLLSVLSDNYPEALAEIKQQLEILSWFEDLDVLPDFIQIKDRFLSESTPKFDQKSANEGFYTCYFITLSFISELTPTFFAIDNVDVSLNPKLCSHLIKSLAELSKTHHKQALLTTHNPALLDGLNLNDDDQRLFVVSRTVEGKTRVRRITIDDKKQNETPSKLSAMFVNGMLGGLPRDFNRMTTVGLISEGITDQIVIEHLLNFLIVDDIEVNPLQPLRDETDDSLQASYGNWTLVFDYCKNSQLMNDALSVNDFVIIHIDTDISEHIGVALTNGGVAKSDEILIEEVKLRIVSKIPPQIYADYQDRIIFAIAVHSLECWLLCLHTQNPKHYAKTLNCQSPLVTELQRQDITHEKTARCYQNLCKPKIIKTKIKQLDQNTSFTIFKAELSEKVALS